MAACRSPPSPELNSNAGNRSTSRFSLKAATFSYWLACGLSSGSRADVTVIFKFASTASARASSNSMPPYTNPCRSERNADIAAGVTSLLRSIFSVFCVLVGFGGSCNYAMRICTMPALHLLFNGFAKQNGRVWPEGFREPSSKAVHSSQGLRDRNVACISACSCSSPNICTEPDFLRRSTLCNAAATPGAGSAIFTGPNPVIPVLNLALSGANLLLVAV